MLLRQARHYRTCIKKIKNMGIANQSYKKSSFGPAFFFLSKQRREALAAYYEFCRRMDDIVDEPNTKNPQQELNFWREEITHIFKQSPQTDLGKQLSEVVKEFSLSQDRFLLLVEGMQDDLNRKTYATLEDLDTYLYRVAVVVGLATLDILGLKGEPAKNLAGHLGRAVQLTNIIRDVPEDAMLGRVYLPQDLLLQYHLTREQILQEKTFPQLPALLGELDQHAVAHYEAAFSFMRGLPLQQQLPCRIMGCVYAKNLAKIRKKGFIFEKPIKLSKFEKITGAVYALFQAVCR